MGLTQISIRNVIERKQFPIRNSSDEKIAYDLKRYWSWSETRFTSWDEFFNLGRICLLSVLEERVVHSSLKQGRVVRVLAAHVDKLKQKLGFPRLMLQITCEHSHHVYKNKKEDRKLRPSQFHIIHKFSMKIC